MYPAPGGKDQLDFSCGNNTHRSLFPLAFSGFYGSVAYLLLAGLFIVLIWVTVWDTYESFVYDYRLLYRKRKLYELISRSEVTVHQPG